MFANLTINSSDADRGLNWFAQIGISPQTLTNFVPEEDVLTTSTTYVRSDQRAQSSVFWISATPGFTFSLGESRRLLLDARFNEGSSFGILEAGNRRDTDDPVRLGALTFAQPAFSSESF